MRETYVIDDERGNVRILQSIGDARFRYETIILDEAGAREVLAKLSALVDRLWPTQEAQS